MNLRYQTRGRRPGTAAVELAVCAPLMIILLTGVWEVGRMVSAQQIIANAVREGGREVAAGQQSAATVKQYVVNYCNMNGLSTVTTSMVTITNITNASRSDPTTANQLDQFRVTLNVPYSSISWSSLAQITSTSTLTASADWYSMKDSPITVNPVIPPN
jgi:Flp pilus assembly protein TadG